MIDVGVTVDGLQWGRREGVEPITNVELPPQSREDPAKGKG